MIRRTALHDAHKTQGAHMVDFAGWHMPLHYGSQIQEHHVVRQSVGLFDVSHMLAVDLQGPSAQADLRQLLANDVIKLAKFPGRALYTCMLNEEAGVLDDMIVYGHSPDSFRVVLNASRALEDVDWIEKHVSSRTKVTPRVDGAILALQGPQAEACLIATLQAPQLQHLAPFHCMALNDLLIGRTGYTGEDGFEIMLPSAQAPSLWQLLLDRGAKPVGLAARDTLRLEAGLMLYGQDLDEEHTPMECGLAWTVALQDDHDFIGRSTLESQDPMCKMVGLLMNEPGVLRRSHLVSTAYGDGVVTSGSFSPTIGYSIALAQVPLSVNHGDQVTVHLRHNGRQTKVRVVKPPFVRFGKILCSHD